MSMYYTPPVNHVLSKRLPDWMNTIPIAALLVHPQVEIRDQHTSSRNRLVISDEHYRAHVGIWARPYKATWASLDLK